MTHHLWIIGRLTLLEARRNRLLWLALLVAAAGLMLAQFLTQVALTESDLIRITVTAALYRLAAVFIVATFTVTSVLREFADKGVDLTLSLPVSRASFALGKLTGFALYALALSVVFALALVLGAGAPLMQTFWWCASLACELILVAAMGTFCAFSLSGSTGAIAAVLGFYLLSRSVAAMQVIAAAPFASDLGVMHSLINHAADFLALLLPRLDLFSRSEWLTSAGPTGGELAIVFGQALLYTILLGAATLIDLYRREL
jgi:ABC-type transport system involved in multi-copper enzyme maturation permease subunit